MNRLKLLVFFGLCCVQSYAASYTPVSTSSLTLLGQTIGVPIPEGIWFTIPFDLEKRDDEDLHSNTEYNSRITISEYGFYQVSAFVTRDATANTSFAIRLLKNGIPAYEYWSITNSIHVLQAKPITVVDEFIPGDILEIQTRVNPSAGTRLTVPTATFFSVYKI